MLILTVDLDKCDHLIRLADSEYSLVLILVSIHGPQTPTLRVVRVHGSYA